MAKERKWQEKESLQHSFCKVWEFSIWSFVQILERGTFLVFCCLSIYFSTCVYCLLCFSLTLHVYFVTY